MTVDFASLKAKTRRIVHNTFAVSANYRSSANAAPVALHVRWHYAVANAKPPVALRSGSELAVDIEGPEKIVFDRDELAANGITPVHAGIVDIPAFGVSLILDTDQPITGPVDVVWVVVRQ